MKRVRVAGLIEIDNSYALMHRKNVKKSKDDPNKPYGEYYVFPGGGVEDDDLSYEDAIKREILEELGINIEVIKEVHKINISEDYVEILYLCKYINGKFASGTGPEFSNDPKYIDRGEYIPTIISKEEIKNIRLIPEEFKNKVLFELL